MVEEVEVTEEILEENGHNPMLEMARKVLLAGIGAMALTQEEIEKFVGKIVVKGSFGREFTGYLSSISTTNAVCQNVQPTIFGCVSSIRRLTISNEVFVVITNASLICAHRGIDVPGA